MTHFEEQRRKLMELFGREMGELVDHPIYERWGKNWLGDPLSRRLKFIPDINKAYTILTDFSIHLALPAIRLENPPVAQDSTGIIATVLRVGPDYKVEPKDDSLMLRDLELEKTKKCMILIGSSGCGKSTLTSAHTISYTPPVDMYRIPMNEKIIELELGSLTLYNPVLVKDWTGHDQNTLKNTIDWIENIQNNCIPKTLETIKDVPKEYVCYLDGDGITDAPLDATSEQLERVNRQIMRFNDLYGAKFGKIEKPKYLITKGDCLTFDEKRAILSGKVPKKDTSKLTNLLGDPKIAEQIYDQLSKKQLSQSARSAVLGSFQNYVDDYALQKGPVIGLVSIFNEPLYRDAAEVLTKLSRV